MSDLSEYHSDKDEIARLNKQVDMMADFYNGFYKGQIKSLTSKLVAKSKSASEYKAKWRMETNQHETPTDKARKLITIDKSKELDETVTFLCTVIAKNVGLTVRSVYRLWYERR